HVRQSAPEVQNPAHRHHDNLRVRGRRGRLLPGGRNRRTLKHRHPVRLRQRVAGRGDPAHHPTRPTPTVPLPKRVVRRPGLGHRLRVPVHQPADPYHRTVLHLGGDRSRGVPALRLPQKPAAHGSLRRRRRVTPVTESRNRVLKTERAGVETHRLFLWGLLLKNFFLQGTQSPAPQSFFGPWFRRLLEIRSVSQGITGPRTCTNSRASAAYNYSKS